MSASQAITPEPAPRYASVVVGTDFSPCSAVAVGHAIRIAAWSGAPLHVVHVVDTGVVTDSEAAISEYVQGIQDHLVRDARQKWEELAARIPGAAALPIEVSVNHRVAAILGHARKHKADLVVLGAFGDRRPDVGLGTVATACVRASTTDVLLVRDTQAGPFNVVVAAVDFSETSARALARAALVAAHDGAELHALHVLDAPWHRLPHLAPLHAAPARLKQQHREALERRLAEFVRPITDAGKATGLRTALHDSGRHRSGIVEYAGSVSADLIVLGTRGRTNLRDMLLGSTAEKALAESACSVLAVKPSGSDHPVAPRGESRAAGQGASPPPATPL
jgi:nucleotide-binding universal stress UspA family protein